jgi:hypothetical protein
VLLLVNCGGILFMKIVVYLICYYLSFDGMLNSSYANLIPCLTVILHSSKCISLASTKVLIGIPNPNILQVSLV